MWSWAEYSRLVAVFALVLLLAGCGFRPLYGQGAAYGDSVPPHFARIEVDSIPERNGQQLRNNLIDRLYVTGRPEKSRYELKIKGLKERSSGLGIRKDASATRAQLNVTAQFTLVDKVTGRTVLNRAVQSINSYNILDSQFTTAVSAADARDRALRELSDQIVMQLSLYFQRRPVENPAMVAEGEDAPANVFVPVNETSYDPTSGYDLLDAEYEHEREKDVIFQDNGSP